jgi:hypothetical protein
VGKAASKVAEAIVPSEEKEAPVDRRARERRGDVYRPEDAFGGGLVGGLLGRAVGGMLRSAVGALGEQMRQAQEQVADVQDRATRIIESNSRLQDAMGGSVRAQPPVSQSSMSQNINGRMSKTVTLIMPVVGSGGRIAQVRRWGWLVGFVGHSPEPPHRPPEYSKLLLTNLPSSASTHPPPAGPGAVCGGRQQRHGSAHSECAPAQRPGHQPGRQQHGGRQNH